MRSLVIALVALGFSFGYLSIAASDTGQNSSDQNQSENIDKDKSDKTPTILERYAPTGDTKSCISLTQISQSNVLSETEIFFEMKGRRGYLNTMPYRCPSLDFYKSYTYKTGINQLCSTDFITVLMGSVGEGASCGLGKFVEYERKPKD